jgi:hypothetical protein
MPFKQGNKEAKKKGKHEKTKQWEELGDAIRNRHTERYNSILDSLPDDKFADKYLQTLEFFAPKLNRTTLVGDTQEPIAVKYTPIGKDRTDK